MSAVRKKISTILLLVYVCTTFALQAGHIHSFAYRTNDRSELSSHDCGTNERHLPAGANLSCVLCQRVLQFVATGVALSPFTTEPAEFLSSTVSPSPIEDARGSSCFSRGPPVLA